MNKDFDTIKATLAERLAPKRHLKKVILDALFDSLTELALDLKIKPTVLNDAGSRETRAKGMYKYARR